MEYVVKNMSVKPTTKGGTYKILTLEKIGDDGTPVFFNNVKMWSTWEGYEFVEEGAKINGEIKTDPRFGMSIEPNDPRSRQMSKLFNKTTKRQGMTEAMEKKQEGIERAQDRKADGILMSGTARDATQVTLAVLQGTPEWSAATVDERMATFWEIWEELREEFINKYN